MEEGPEFWKKLSLVSNEWVVFSFEEKDSMHLPIGLWITPCVPASWRSREAPQLQVFLSAETTDMPTVVNCVYIEHMDLPDPYTHVQKHLGHVQDNCRLS